MQKTSTKEHWRTYRNTSDHQPPVVHDVLMSELTNVINVSGKKILEVGAGMGGDSVHLAKLGAKVTTLDYTDESLKAIESHAKKNKVHIETVKGDARELPFKDNSFDVVFHQGLLEHFKDPLALVKEHARVLKVGGYLIIDVPQTYTTYTIKKKIEIARGTWFAGWERAFTVGELEGLMQKSGLHIKRSYGWGYYGKLHNLRYLHLGSWYTSLWDSIERSRLKLYLNWCIGVIGQK